MIHTVSGAAVPTLAALPDALLAEGRSSVTAAEAAGITGKTVVLARQGLQRLIAAGRVVSPVRGLYVPIAAEYRRWGAPPALDIVDGMMHHLGRRYYVGLLSAAELHGAGHQRPQVFQVVVDRQVTDRRIGRSDFRFISSTLMATVPVVSRNSATGSVNVSSPEATMFDLALRPGAAGGLDNVATIIGELAGEGLVNLTELAVAARSFPASAVRRVGWMLATFCGIDATAELATSPADHSRLDPHGDRGGPIDPTWKLILNASIEPDL